MTTLTPGKLSVDPLDKGLGGTRASLSDKEEWKIYALISKYEVKFHTHAKELEKLLCSISWPSPLCHHRFKSTIPAFGRKDWWKLKKPRTIIDPMPKQSSNLPRITDHPTKSLSRASLKRPPLLSHLILSQQFIEPEGSLLHWQETSNSPYPEPDQSSQYPPCYLSKIHCNIIHQFTSVFLVASGFPTNNLYIFHFPSHTACPAHLMLFDFIILITLGKEYKLWSSLLCSFSTLPSLHIQIFSSAPYSQKPSVCSSLNARHQVLHAYRTTGKIIILYISVFVFFNSRQEDRGYWTEW
jgi:hypothetical protein